MASSDGRGTASLEALLARKPLTPAEKRFPATTVCVTGAAGYMAAHLVARLLAAGHTVHATHRPGKDNQVAVDWLTALPVAQGRLKWFAADLLEEGSFDAALRGCKVVFHTAGAVDVSPKAGMERCVVPAVRGVANLLASVNRTPGVARVIMTSSMAAALDTCPPDSELTEANWGLRFLTAGVPYLTSKTLSEWEAWAIASQRQAQRGAWRLVCILPSIFIGPPVAPGACQSSALRTVLQMLDGKVPFYVPMDMNTVDVRDVAAAHALAMVTPHASGRYLLSQSSGQSTTDILALLRELYPGYRVAHLPLARWLSVPAGMAVGISAAWMHLAYGTTARLSSKRVQEELGVSFIPLRETLDDMVQTFVADGSLPPHETAAQLASRSPLLVWRWALPALTVATALVALCTATIRSNTVA